MTLIARKYRAYPTEDQKIYFAKTFGCSRFIYNKLVEEMTNNYEEYKKEKVKPGASKDLKVKKINEVSHYKNQEEYKWLKEVDSLALSNAKINAETALQNFFRNVKQGKTPGYPKFKKKYNSRQSYTTNNVNNSIRLVTQKNKADHNRTFVNLPKIKEIEIVCHRSLKGKIKSCTISKTCSDKYFISILVEQDQSQIDKLPETTKEVGIDLGLKELAVLSDGTSYANPKTLYKHEEELKHLQRMVSRRTKGSNRRNMAQKRLAKKHEQIRNIRSNYLHQVSKDIIIVYRQNSTFPGFSSISPSLQ